MNFSGFKVINSITACQCQYLEYAAAAAAAANDDDDDDDDDDNYDDNDDDDDLELIRSSESSVVSVSRELKDVNKDVLKQLKLMTEDIQVQTGNAIISASDQLFSS